VALRKVEKTYDYSERFSFLINKKKGGGKQKMSANQNLRKAKKEKNDEFYTQFEDVNRECQHYRDYFRDKVIFCNCDDPAESNFWRFFALNFDFFGLKKLIATHYEENQCSYKLELLRRENGGDINGDGRIDELDTIRTPLQMNGDFRSPECIEILKEADIVVTNPPFSLFREYIQLLMEYDKKFLVLGNMNAITYAEIFPLIKDNKLWLGYSSPKAFVEPDGGIKKFGNILWYTNLPVSKRNDPLILYREYNPIDYPKYDNYDAINVDKVKDVPCDYYGVMGVPITFLGCYSPGQFEIIKFRKGDNEKDLSISGKPLYFRILIRRKC
jgi:hypothetical protein